jgi:hypothetical protein
MSTAYTQEHHRNNTQQSVPLYRSFRKGSILNERSDNNTIRLFTVKISNDTWNSNAEESSIGRLLDDIAEENVLD